MSTRNNNKPSNPVIPEKTRGEKARIICDEIDSQIVTFQEWRAGFQLTLVKAVLFTMTEEGDVTPTQHLVNKMSENLLQGADGRSLLAWLEKYGMCHINAGEDGEKPKVKFNKKGRKDINAPEGLKASMWWKCKPQKMFDGFDQHVEITKLIAKSSKMKMKDGEEGEKVHVDEAELRCLRELALGKSALIMQLLDVHASEQALKLNAA